MSKYAASTTAGLRFAFGSASHRGRIVAVTTEAAAPPVVAVIAARNEADRIGATLAALGEALPGAELIVADDASDDATAEVARAHGAVVVSRDGPSAREGT